MICPNCGAENAEGAPYCYNCANPLPQTSATPPQQPGGYQAPPGGPYPPAPPGGGYQPPAGGGFPPGGPPPGGPVKPPRGPFSAGLGALVAFLVVAAIGIVLFLTVFHKKSAPGPAPTQTQVAGPTSSQGPTATGGATTTGGGTTTPTTTQSTTTGGGTTTTGGGTTTPTTTQGGRTTQSRGGGTPKVQVFICTITFQQCPPTPAVRAPRTISGIGVKLRLFNFPAGGTFTVVFINKSTNLPVAETQALHTDGSPEQRFRVTLRAPPGGFPNITLVLGLRVNGQVLGFNPPRTITFV